MEPGALALLRDKSQPTKKAAKEEEKAKLTIVAEQERIVTEEERQARALIIENAKKKTIKARKRHGNKNIVAEQSEADQEHAKDTFD